MGPRKAHCGKAHSPAFGAALTLRYSMNPPAHQPDWNPRADDVQHNQIRAYDEVAGRCPVAFSEMLHWSVFHHAGVMRVLLDPVTFSNAVSRHVAVPNGMDPPEHTAYRRAIEPYFSAQRVDAFEPACREIAAALAQALAGGGEVEMIATFALPFAVRAQCAFLGWPETLQASLTQWLQKNQAATLAQDRPALAALALEFDGIVAGLLQARQQAGAAAPRDLTTALMHETVNGARMSAADITSILRNWTVGEIGTIAAAVGILAQWLAEHGDVQAQLRENSALVPAAIEEILRMHGPLATNRRVTTCPVDLGGRSIGAGERVTIHWTSANRDGHVFEQPDTFRLDRDPSENLLYGAGIHVCPGAPLARMELRVALQALLSATTRWQPAPGGGAVPAVYPASGFSSLRLFVQ